MRCPKCGAENPDRAEFCSLCTERLRETATAAGPESRHATSGRYVAPGEWRGDAEVLRPALSEAVEKKVRRFRWKLLAYGVAVAAVVIWLALSLTVWSNPSPGEVCKRLLDAANTRDQASFTQLFIPQDRAVAEGMYQNVIAYLGGSGRFSGVNMRANKLDEYSARCYLEGGSIEAAGGKVFEITKGSNLIVSMENRDGRWYVTARGTNIIP